MQRTAEEIVEWNIKKIDSGVCHLQKRLRQICLSLEDCHYDAPRANLIVNNMMVNIDHLEEDVNRLFNTLGIVDDGLTPRETFKKMNYGTRRSKSVKNLTEIGTRETMPYVLYGDPTPPLNQTLDRAAHNQVVKQVKALESIVISGNIAKRIEKLEKDQTSKDFQQLLEKVEKEVFGFGDVRARIKMLGEKAETEISGKIASLEKLVNRIVKVVFGGESGIDEHSENCVIRKLTDFGNLLNEGKADIRSLEQRVTDLEYELDNDQSSHSDSDDDPEPIAYSRADYQNVNRGVIKKKAAVDAVAFSVKVDHSGPWENGCVIRDIASVEENLGDAFDEEKCWFVPPVSGTYKFFMRIKRLDSGSTIVEAWTCGVENGGWIGCLFQLKLHGDMRYKSFVHQGHLDANVAIRLRVSGGTRFEDCLFKGMLLKAGTE